MSTHSTFQRSSADQPLPAASAWHWFQDRILAYRRASERRRVLRRLQELRDRDPRLFEETGVDPIDLPPPRQAGVPIFAQTVVASFLSGGRL